MINHKAKLVSINLSRTDLYLNRRPSRGILTNPGSFLIKWSDCVKLGASAVEPLISNFRHRGEAKYDIVKTLGEIGDARAVKKLQKTCKKLVKNLPKNLGKMR